MKILFLGNKGDFHVDAWMKYFKKNNEVYLFSEDSSLLPDRQFKNVEVLLNNGILGSFLKFIKSESRLLLHFNKVISVKVFAKAIEKIILKKKIDIIHAHSLYYGFLASFLKINIPIIFTPMGSDIIIHAFKSRFYNFMAKRAYNSCQIITGDSKLIQRKGYELGASESNNYIIQNGVDSKIFYPSKNSIKNSYGLSESDILLFSPRAIEPLYNIDIIIDSIYLLSKEKFSVKCMFSYAFGDEYLESLKTKVNNYGIEENIIWLGYLSYQDMAKKYNAADIVLSIPKSDSSPRSVYEGMFCGKPVIISNLEWNQEFLTSDSVYTLDHINAKNLSKAVKHLHHNKDLNLKICHNAKIIAKKYFDYDSNMTQMERLMVKHLEDR